MNHHSSFRHAVRILLALCSLTIPLGVAFFLFTFETAFATSYTVGGACGSTIQTCINYATHGDTIIIPAGTYTESLTLGKAISLTGASAATTRIRAISNQRVITVTGSVISNSVIISGVTFFGGNPGTSGGGVYVTNGAQLQFTNVVITNNVASGSNAGGIIVDFSEVTLNNTQIVSNSSTTGGGVYNNFGAITLTNSSVMTNTATGFGGGIHNNAGALILINSSVISNTAITGGGIRNEVGTVTMVNGTVMSNSVSSFGGGIYNNDVLTLTGASFLGNSAERGGGIYNALGHDAFISRSTFSHNDGAGSGGGIRNEGAMTITNSTLYGNTAGTTTGGGGAYNAGTMTITSATLSGNSAPDNGGGIRSFTGATTYLVNTIVANSLLGGNCAGTVTSGGSNLQWNPNSGCGTPAFAAGDPKLAALGDYGGPTQTMALYVGSAAINAGNNDLCPSIDQRGFTRPLSIPDPCDQGAFEGSWYPQYLPLIFR